MGIPSYFSYIIKSYPEIITNINTNINTNNLKSTDNFYLDCNSIIYDIYNSLDNNLIIENIEQLIIIKVCEKIEFFINFIKPLKTVIIAFDGVAPLAKMDQQRKRRYKSYYQNKIYNNIYGESNKNWNSSSITPGTLFMIELNKIIKDYFSNVKDLEIIINSSDIYGEGEHKIFEYIRNNKLKHYNESTIIYGLDSDLIILAITHLPICPNINLFRDSKEFNKKEIYQLLNIPLLTNKTISFMTDNKLLNNNLIKFKIFDYIFLSFFLGNDFLPHFPSLNIRTGGIDKLLSAYKILFGNSSNCLTNGENIIWNNVRKLIQFLADKELFYLKEEEKFRNKMENYKYLENTTDEKFKKFEMIPTLERETEKFINPNKEYWETRYYQSLINIKYDFDNEKIKKLCINYLEGLEWNFKYYLNGCPDWRWTYKYNYPPLLIDLIKYIPVFNTTFIETIQPNPVSKIVQLCYVLSKNSFNLIPQIISNKLLNDHPEWYKNEYNFEWSYCKFFWESNVKMNEINIEELEVLISDLIK